MKRSPVRVDESGEFVGALITPDGIAVVLPKFYGSTLFDLARSRIGTLRAISTLFTILRKYGHDTGFSGDAGTRDQRDAAPGRLLGTADIAAALSAASSLAEDYVRNGLLGKRALAVASEGVPDWGRTIARSVPQLQADVPVYMTPVLKRRRRDWDDELVRLHATVVQEIASLLALPLDVPNHVVMDRGQYASYKAHPQKRLSELRNRTFRERDIHVLELIGMYFQSRLGAVGGMATSSILIGIADFEFVWEHMLRVVFSNAWGNRLARLPAGIWRAAPAWEPEVGLAPRVDFARAQLKPGKRHSVELEYFFLFDAKYIWDPSESARWALNADLYKQMIYARLLRLPASEHVVNALVFPQMSQVLDLRRDVLRLKGLHTWKEDSSMAVFEIVGDFDRIAQAYLGKITLDAEAEIQNLLASASAILAGSKTKGK